MDSRKRKFSLDWSEPSTSSNVSKIVKTTIPKPLSKEEIEEIVKHIWMRGLDTEMTRLHLEKLKTLSQYNLENNIIILACIFKYMNELFKHSIDNTHIYVKAQLLSIIRKNTKRLTNGNIYIEEISSNTHLAEFLFNSFALDENETIQEILFQFLTLIITHIKEFQNNASNWELHWLHCNYLVGNNVMCLLINSAKDKVLMEGITMLEALSQDISSRTDFLKHIYNLNNLVCTAIKCFWKYDAMQQTDAAFQSLKWWEFARKWQNLIMNINRRNSFLTACGDITDITYEILCILRIVNVILHRSKNSLESLSKETLEMSYPALYKCTLLLYSIPRSVYTPKIDKCIETILQCHNKNLGNMIKSINEEQPKAIDKNLPTIQDDINIMDQYLCNMNNMMQYLDEKQKYWNPERIHKIERKKAKSSVIEYDINSVDINISQEEFEKMRL